MARWKTHPELLTDGLGVKWEQLNILRKSYTACHCTHTAADGIIAQMAENQFAPKDIENIHIEESTINYSVAVVPKDLKWNPQTIPECQFSLPYIVAMAAYEGDIFLDAYTPEARRRFSMFTPRRTCSPMAAFHCTAASVAIHPLPRLTSSPKAS